MPQNEALAKNSGARVQEFATLPADWYARAWLSVPALVLVLAATLFIAKILVKPPGPIPPDLFADYNLIECRPEPLEQVRYILAITVIPLLIWILALWQSKAGKTAGVQKLGRKPTRSAVMLIQLAVVCFVGIMWWFHLDETTPFFGLRELAVGGACFGMAGFFYWLTQRIKPLQNLVGPLNYGLWSRLIPAILATALCVFLESREGFVTTTGVVHARYNTQVHLPFTSGEFAAELNGRTALVDFFPQYVTLLPYLLSPIFRVTGFSITRFSAVMAIMSVIEAMFIFGALRLLTQNAWHALAMFVMTLGVGRLVLFTGYYAIAPLRLFFPLLILYFLAWYLRNPTWLRAALVMAFGGIAAVNNLDFGAPAFIAASAAILLCGPKTLLPQPSRWGIVALLACAGLGVALAILIGISLFRSGRFPNFAYLFFYQKVFAVTGFNMLPMPDWGLHWVIYLGFMVALATAILRLSMFRRKVLVQSDLRKPLPLTPTELTQDGLLIFSGIFGCGMFAYYVGRSHPDVLAVGFPMWSFSLAILTWMSFRPPPGEKLRLRSGIRLVPSLLLAVGAMACVGSLYRPASAGEVTSPQLAAEVPEIRKEWAEIIRHETTPREAVAIICPYGHQIALDAGVNNVYPYEYPGSTSVEGTMILQSQVELATNQILSDHVRSVFGVLSYSMKESLTRQKFHLLWRRPDGFELWRQ